MGGFFFGCVQMVLYCCYRKPRPASVVLAAESAEMELPLAALDAAAVLPECAVPVLQKLEEAVGSPRKGGVKAI